MAPPQFLLSARSLLSAAAVCITLAIVPGLGAALPDPQPLLEHGLVERNRVQDVQNCGQLLIVLAASSFCSSFAHITDTTRTYTSTSRPVSTVVTVTAGCTSTSTRPPVTNTVTSTITIPFATQTVTLPASTETDSVTIPGSTFSEGLTLPGQTIEETITIPGPTEVDTVTIPAIMSLPS